MEFTRNMQIGVLVVAIAALALLIFRIWRRGRGRCKLSRDSSGLWRYHKDTQFQRKVAYKGVASKEIASNEVAEDEKSEVKPIAVLTFVGDIKAKQNKLLAKLVDEVVVNKEELGEVVVVITSPGGSVPPYGHAFSQVERIRNAGLKLTVCIDVVAASGGYLMSVPAHKIIAAPFAVVGSVGVMAFVPNIRKLLSNHDIDPRTFTSGKYKRTVSFTDEATGEEITRFNGQLETIHRLFLSAVKKYRKDVNMEVIETGEHWSASESVELGLGLVDEIATSQEYLLEANREVDLILLSHKRNLMEDGLIGRFAGALVDSIESRLLSYVRFGGLA